MNGEMFCGLHYDRACDCDYHCTGCPNTYGLIDPDCCTCCYEVNK
jgi:hypothetical protein